MGRLLNGSWKGPRAVKNPPEIAALDTEDNSKTGFISAAFVGNGRRELFKSKAETQAFLCDNDFGRLQVWAHNLEYDLVNVFRGSFGACRWEYYGGRLLGASMYGSRLTFANSMNLAPMALAKAGEIIGLEKLPFDPNSEEYVYRDTEIVYKLMNGLRDYLESLGGALKRTIGASAMFLWARQYAELPLPVVSEQVRLWFRRAYYGGRVEVFRYGKQSGNFSYIDVNSLYPSVMVGEYPRLWDLRIGGKHGIAHCRVKAPAGITYPALPYRDGEGKISFPAGRWEGYYCTNELEYARSLGYEIKIIDVVGSDHMSLPFAGYVSDLYAKRKKSKGSEKTFLKLLLNSLYGKFGTVGGDVKEIKPIAKCKGAYIPVDATAGATFRQSPPPKYGNILWAAWTTAAARIVLHKAIMRTVKAGGTPLYCDTDSLIISGPCPFKDSPELGDWKLEETLSTFQAKGPKFYHYKVKGGGNVYKAKGVKRTKAKDLFQTGKASFERPLRLRECMVRKEGVTIDGKLLEGGELANCWITQTKHDLKPEPRRNVLPGGLTSPPILGRIKA